MIELNLDLKIHTKPWKKALFFSFLFYLVVLLILIVMITFVKKDFDFMLVSVISGTYMSALTFSFYYIYRIFDAKFSSLT